jgi:hypothetical protein
VHPLDAPRAKINRAEEQLDALSKEIKRVMQPDVYASSAELNPIDDSYSVFLEKQIGLPSEKWGIALGEILHNARGALDHLIAGLVVAAGRTPHSRHQFPIVKDDAEWDRLVVDPPKNGKRGFLDYIPTNQVALVKAVQPYTTTTGKPSLFTLQRFSNADKHRLIHAAATWVTKSPEVNIRVGFPVPLRRVTHHPPGTPLGSRTEVARAYPVVARSDLPALGFDLSNPHVEVDVHLSLTTVFGEPGEEDTRIRDFRACLDDIRRIVESFAAVFPATATQG